MHLTVSIVSLLLSVGVLVFVIWNGRKIKRINDRTAANNARTAEANTSTRAILASTQAILDQRKDRR